MKFTRGSSNLILRYGNEQEIKPDTTNKSNDDSNIGRKNESDPH